MRVLVDIAHPAHVHFYRFMLEEFTAQGHQWRVASRDKDVTNGLLDSLGIQHTSISSAGSGLAGLSLEMFQRDARLLRIAREFRPDVILTRSPSGTHIGRLMRIPSVFDTDNGKSAGIHWRATAPFASVITTPDCMPANLGRKQVRYPSYKPLAFLHPNRFTPDPDIRSRLGIESNKRYAVIRLVSMTASHDSGEIGLSYELVERAIDVLETDGSVFLSSEKPLPSRFEDFALPTAANEFHSVLAGAGVVLADSGSVVQEAAVLGCPSVFVSSFTGRIEAIRELQTKYGLVQSFHPHESERVLTALASLPSEVERQRNRAALIDDKVDLTGWYVDLVRNVFKRDSLRRTIRP